MIKNSDIVLFQSQDNTDNDNGGGQRINTTVKDGAINDVFPDISRIDTTSGSVNLRKVHPVVNTDNNEIYYGAHAIVRKNADDPNVSAMIFHTDSPSDERLQAQKLIESYVVTSYKAGFYMFGNHVKGAKAITWLQRLTETIPDVGEVYVLIDPVTKFEQYVRVSDFEYTTVTLGWNAADYKRRRIIAVIEQPLEFAFQGSAFHPDGQIDGSVDTYTTQVADAAKFYGVKDVSVDAEIGATSVQVADMFEQIVPASTKQTPLVNQNAMAAGELLIPGVGELTVSANDTIGGVTSVGTPITPGSIVNSWYKDDGNGNIINIGNGNIAGSVDYVSGTYSQSVYSGTHNVDYRVANLINSTVQYSGVIKVSQENQGLVFIQNVSPMPTLPNAYIDYRSDGKWYRISANQDGTMGGDNRIGVGNINDNGDGTGTISITLGATPEIDSVIIFSWGSGDTMDKITSDDINLNASLEIPLGKTNIDAATFSMVAFSTVHGSDKTITSDANGVLSDTAGTIHGKLDMVGGILIVNKSQYATRFPDHNSADDVTINFDYADSSSTPAHETVQSYHASAQVNADIVFTSQDNVTGVTIFQMPIVPELATLKLEIQLSMNFGGGIIVYPAQRLYCEVTPDGKIRKVNRRFDDNTTFGTVTAQGLVTIQTPIYSYHTGAGSYTGGIGMSHNSVAKPRGLSGVTCKVKGTTTVTNSLSHQIIGTMKSIAKYKVTAPPRIAGEIAVNLFGNNQITSKDGNLFDKDGVQIGSINYTVGELNLSYFNDPDDFSYDVLSMTTDEYSVIQPAQVRSAAFRTSATALTTSSLQIRYDTGNGINTATVDGNGQIQGTDLVVAGGESYVDPSTGYCVLVFSTNVDATNIKYDAVAETSLPLDPQLLGLNPVRLPPNGRVPIFSAGRHLVIFHEQSTDVSGTPAAGSTLQLTRTNLAYIEVLDVNNQRLDYAQYTIDKKLGTITFNGDIAWIDRQGDALTAPFTVVDRIEEMVLCTAAELPGYLGLSAPLQRAYPKDETKVASALVWGNVGSRVYSLFSQKLFNEWSDELTADPIAAKFDDVNNPIVVNNKDSFTGRWYFKFVSGSTVQIVEESLGVIDAAAAINQDIAPVNPATGQPYFTIPFGGWGAGWVTGNILRFNTESGSTNMWVIRTVQSGKLTVEKDSIDIEVRGDAN